MPCSLDPALSPEPRWSTHAVCLTRLADAATRGLDLVDVAGLTGIAFRTALCSQATPASFYHSWAWEPQLRLWCSALGLDIDVTAHSHAFATFDPWLTRQAEHITACLARGFPVLYWDNVAFGLILGQVEDRYLVSGIPRDMVHPYWFEHPDSSTLEGRAYSSELEVSPLFPATLAELAPVVDTDLLFAYPQGVTPFDTEQAAVQSLASAWAELAGQIEYPRRRDRLDLVYAPEFGSDAFTRLHQELLAGTVHHFGLIQQVQALTEARAWAAQYLKRLVDRVPPAWQERVAQLAQFYEQIVQYLRPVAGFYRLPLDEKTQLKRHRLETAAEAFYQVQQTELAARRILGTLARETGAAHGACP